MGPAGKSNISRAKTMAASYEREPHGNAFASGFEMLGAPGVGSTTLGSLAVGVAVAVPMPGTTFSVTITPIDGSNTEPTVGGARVGPSAVPFVGVGPFSLNAVAPGLIGASDSIGEQSAEA